MQRIISSRNFKVNPVLLEQLFGFSLLNDTRSITAALKQQTFQPDLAVDLSKGVVSGHYSVLQLPELHDKWMAYVHDPYPAHYYPRPYNWVESSHKAREAFSAVSTKAKYSFSELIVARMDVSYFPDFIKTLFRIKIRSMSFRTSFLPLDVCQNSTYCMPVI
jgi:hypothetical protein